MRFITEFKVPEYFQSNRRIHYVPEKRHMMEVGMGNMIAESFGWQNPVNHNLDHHRLEIEAFPMDKWVEFKKRLFAHLGTTGLYDKTFKDLISELESFRNPVT